MELGLKRKYALVTGGTHGIGRAIALALADEGCNVAICSRDEKNISSTILEIKKRKVKCLGLKADVMESSDIKIVMKKVIDAWKTIHILINNVGGGGRWGSEIIEDTEENVWLDVYNKNALAAIRFTTLAIPFMRKQRWGRVVTITSIFGREGGGRPWYNVAKAAQTSLMKTLAMTGYLAKSGITFNSVAPGSIMIPGTGWDKAYRERPEEVKDFIEKEVPIGRFGTPDEVASLVVFLSSDKANFINGASIPVDGGQGRSNI